MTSTNAEIPTGRFSWSRLRGRESSLRISLQRFLSLVKLNGGDGDDGEGGDGGDGNDGNDHQERC